MMDRRDIERAANLLAKAQSTSFDEEAIALVEKSYSLLAAVITTFDETTDPAPSGARRRERRHLRDRRGARRFGIFGAPSGGADPATTYGQLAKDLRPQPETHFDLEA
jgi:hypothetical protein